jgi:outer membrane protein assembly factor BamA
VKSDFQTLRARIRCRLGFVFIVTAVWVLSLTPSSAQETRAAIVEREQAAKAQVARPREPGVLEKLIGYIDRNDLIDRFAEGDGLFPLIGGITSGGGLGFGGGYRRHLFDYGAVFEVSAVASPKGYQEAAVKFAHQRLLKDRLEIGGDFTYRSFPQEDFYGLGLASLDTNRVSYAIEGTDTALFAAVRPRPWLTGGTRVGLLSTTLAGGTDSRFPSIESNFFEATAPGFETQPDYLYTEVFADVDTRDEVGNPRSGTHHRVSWVRYDDDLGAFSFSRLTAEANHFFPVFDKKRVFLVRAKAALSEPVAGNTVPFFLMPTLGGSHTLRSHPDYRFRDSNVLVLNAEYRWEAFSNLDMAVFADAGTVWSSRADLDLGTLKKAYGLGFRFNTSSDVFYRIDIAHGEEGFQFLFKFSGPFKDRGAWPDDTRSHRHRALP